MSIQDVLVGLRQALSGGGAGGRFLMLGFLLLIAVIALVVVVVWFVRQQSPSGRVEALLEERAADSRASRWIPRLAVVLFLVGLAAGIELYAGNPAQCDRCHQGSNYDEEVADSAHQGLSCMSCHRQGGPVLGRVAQAGAYSRWILVYSSRKATPEPAPGSVSDASCLRCHTEIRQGTVTANGIRVRHRDFLGEGSRCRECHNAVAHHVIEPSDPTMDKCLPCHDGTTASSECELCHERDVIEARKDRRGMPSAEFDTGDCYGCHDEKPCLRCHGVTMPHPRDWLPNAGGPGFSGSHAREAFQDRDTCWRCHDAEDEPLQPDMSGCRCHASSFGKMHGGKAWVKEHSLQATGQKTGVASECYMCHDKRMCENCHPKSYNDRYAPRSGPDQYLRDPGFPYDPDYWEW